MCGTLAPSCASSQMLDYQRFSGYGIGKGFIGNDFANPLPACIKGEKSSLPASRAGVRVSIATNAREYKQAFHLDHKGEASFLGFGGGDELRFGRETGSSDSAFDIIVEAYSERDSETIDNVRWGAPYDSMMASEDPAKIRAVRLACGDRFIQTVFNEVRLFAVMRVSSTKSSSLSQFVGKLRGRADLDVISASSEVGGDHNVIQAHSAGALHIEIHSVGLGGIAPTASLIGVANSDGIAAVASKLASALSSLTPPGEPAKYQLAPLPGIQTEDLSAEIIFESLDDLKSSYLSASKRLRNVKDLLDPNDQRRSLYVQPQADSGLKALRASIQAFIDAVSSAHEVCRTAVTPASCTSAASQLPSAPQHSKLELPPKPQAPAHFSGYVWLVDGRPIPEVQASAIMVANESSILGGARSIKPSAREVDLVAKISSPYVSHVDLMLMAPNPAGGFPTTLGSTRIYPQLRHLEGDHQTAVVHLIHADDQNPCVWGIFNGFKTVNPSCVTPAGELLRKIAAASAATTVVAYGSDVPPDGKELPLFGIALDCFAQSLGVMWARQSFFMARNPPGSSSVSVTAQMWIDTANVALLVSSEQETHELSTWSALKSSRSAQLHSMGTPLGSCFAHIP